MAEQPRSLGMPEWDVLDIKEDDNAEPADAEHGEHDDSDE